MAIDTDIINLNNAFVSSSITSTESKPDVYNQQFHLPCYTINNSNKIQTNFKHGPPPPQHTHNITHSPSTNPKTKTNVSDETTLTLPQSSNTTIITEPTTIITEPTTIITDPTTNNTTNNQNISPNQWRYIQNKMNNIIPFIHAIQNNELSHTYEHTPNNDNNLIEEEDNSDHLSDDDVLNNLDMPSDKPKHVYKSSMTVTFDPKGYDGVINALDVLQTFFNVNNKGNNPETDESIHESTCNMETNSDDDVLNMDFDNNVNNNDPFDTDVSDESHDIISKSHNNLHVKNKHSEYDKLVFDIAHSTNTRSNSISIDKQVEKKESHNNKNQHTRKATPIPRKNKYRLKSPKTANNMDMNMNEYGHAHTMNKKNTLSLTEILSETNKRNYNITPQSQTQISQYLMPNPNIISPSHSMRSPTEISLDNADQYEYKVMNNGGMKEISQSYQIKPIINNHNNTVQNNNNNNNTELTNVDIIKEEHEYDTYNYNQHMHEIGLILKQPSHSNTNNRHIYRYKSLNKMDDNDNDGDNEAIHTHTDTYINKLVTIPSVGSQHSDTNNNKQNDGSMIAHFDEQSTRTFQKDFASTVNSVDIDHTPKAKYDSINNTFNPKYIINRNKSLNMDETDEEISLVQSVQTKTKSIELVEYIDDKKIISSPHQYAIRSNITSIDDDNNNTSNTSTIEHQHNVVVIHEENNNNNNNNNEIGNKVSICYLPCPYLNNSKAMLSMCFILGFIMGLLPGFFGYPWKFFE